MSLAPPDPGLAGVAQRHAQVLGQPPRVPPVDTRELSPPLRAVLTQMNSLGEALQSRDPIGHLLDPPPGFDLAEGLAGLPEITRTMVHHADLFTRHSEVGMQLLLRGTLLPRDRELAVLRTAWLCRAPYEWGEHVLVAKAVGISSEEIERVISGAEAPGWSEDDRAILRAVEELHADAMICDETWDRLAARLNEQQLIELPILVGQYQSVAYYQNALRLRLHWGNRGLDAR